MSKKLFTDKIVVTTVRNESSELISIIMRDEKSGKHLVYMVQEATSDDIVDKLIQPDFKIPVKE